MPARPLSLALVGASLLLALSAPAAAADPLEEKLTGELPAVLAAAAPDELIPVSVVLADQLTGPRLHSAIQGATGREQRRAAAVSALKEHAARTQVGVRVLLGSAESEGRAEGLRFLWLGNVVSGSLTPEMVRLAAAHPAVERVNWNPERDIFLRLPADSSGPGTGDGPGIAEVECGTDLMQAPRVWDELGNTGKGALVAVIDTGVCWRHPDIASRIWVNPGEDLDGDGAVMDEDDLNGFDDDGNGYVDDLIGWNFDTMETDPDDQDGHGSHCAGTVAGDGTGGTAAGVAPGSVIMIVRDPSSADEAGTWEAIQYAVDNGAQVASMSFGWKPEWEPDRHTWRTLSENAIDAGMILVIAAGNEGGGAEPWNLRTPGDVPRVITVGATDCADGIADFSSRGPVTWQEVSPWRDHPYPPGLVKPDVSAPGDQTLSHNQCTGYTAKSGTSMATPHVAGTVALMLSANPELLHDDVKTILEQSSVDLGDPGRDNDFGAGRVDAYEAVLASRSSRGTFYIVESATGCTGSLTVVVADADLEGDGTVTVEVASLTETTPEVVSLAETAAGSGVFRGILPVGPGTPAPDGVIQVVDGDEVAATYVDADDGSGGVNLPRTDRAGVDCRGPVITGVTATEIMDTRATIRWSTDEAADSRVTYGDASPPSQERSALGLVGYHAVTLAGLQECTVYLLEVASTDGQGNETRDDDGGRYHRFETYRDSGQGLQPCHAGTVALDLHEVGCEDLLPVTLADPDLNLSTTGIDTATVSASSTTEIAPEEMTLLETGPDTGIFSGSITVEGAPLMSVDGLLQVADGDAVTVTYHDADDGTGSTALSTDSGEVFCRGARATYIRVVETGDTWADLRITTDRATTVTVDWGETAALGRQVVDAGLVTDRVLRLTPIAPCGRVYFRVQAADAHGNGSVFDAAGVPFELNAGDVPGALFLDDFETDAGWSLEGEWEIDEPQGLGTSPGDPSSAISGTRVLGHDLSGLGAYPGDFEPNTTESAVSPVLDASGLVGAELRFNRMLNVVSGAIARLEVKDAGGVWQEIWATPNFGGHSDTSWRLQVYDISAYADGNPSLQVRFKQESRSPLAFSAGWTVDRFIVRDGSFPEYAACGGCGGGARFAGVTLAEDADPCGAGGVTLSWEVPPAWGTGTSGTYAVYRETSPGFTPTASNLVASGLERTTWTDPSAPTGTNLYYVVRAENDETCSDGPNNGGVVDDNLVEVSVVDETSQPSPAPVGPSLRLESINAVHLRLRWEASAGAASYHVRRSDSPAGELPLVADAPANLFDDHEQLLSGASAFYLVVAADSCGNDVP